MYWLIGILAFGCLYFAVRFYLVRREIRRVTVHIGELSANARYGRRLYLEENDRALTQVLLEINRMVDDYEQQLRRGREMERNIRLSISGISHDLRTPLTSMAGYLQLLRKSPSPDKQEPYLRVIMDSVKVIQELTESFYELSRLELDGNNYVIQSMNLEHAVCECLLRFHEDFARKELELDIQDAGTPPVVQADPIALQRILHNLIQNLLRYARGMVTVSFSEEDGYHAVRLSNETEFPLPDNVDSIFDRFYTADQSRGGQGMGLGLYISRKLVDGMNGAIAARRDGQRLHITIQLPITETPQTSASVLTDSR